MIVMSDYLSHTTIIANHYENDLRYERTKISLLSPMRLIVNECESQVRLTKYIVHTI